MFTSVRTPVHTQYFHSMAQAMSDKLFFLNHINPTPNHVFVDFGCGDGTLLSHLAHTGATLIGYDLCPIALKQAQRTVDGTFTTCLDTLLFTLDQYAHRPITLIVSSVLHEVHAYGSQRDVDAFWSLVNTGPWHSVALRDMAVDEALSTRSNPLLAQRVRRALPSWQVADFENTWGSLDNVHTLTHFLLTYHYVDNWQRELAENYLPESSQSILSRFSDWHTGILSHAPLPFLEQQLQEDVGISFPSATHLKLLAYR